MRTASQVLLLIVFSVAAIAIGSVVAQRLGLKSTEAAVFFGLLILSPVAIWTQYSGWKARRDAQRFRGSTRP